MGKNSGVKRLDEIYGNTERDDDDDDRGVYELPDERRYDTREAQNSDEGMSKLHEELDEVRAMLLGRRVVRRGTVQPASSKEHQHAPSSRRHATSPVNIEKCVAVLSCWAVHTLGRILVQYRWPGMNLAGASVALAGSSALLGGVLKRAWVVNACAGSQRWRLPDHADDPELCETEPS